MKNTVYYIFLSLLTEKYKPFQTKSENLRKIKIPNVYNPYKNNKNIFK